MSFTPSQNEKIILGLLHQANALDEDSAMKAAELEHHSASQGLKGAAFEVAIMNLIDHDLVEYEMDENALASCFWLLEE